MLNKYWQQFKSGTDIRGIASTGVKNEFVNLTEEAVTKIALGYAMWLCKKLKKPATDLFISIGRDSRISGPTIINTVKKAFVSIGVSVIDCGLASTPSMFMTTVDLKCDGAVQITASHHPFNRNGLKFFTRNGGLEGSDISEILQNAQDEYFSPITNSGTITEKDFMSIYSQELCNMICKEVNAEDYSKPLKGFKIVVDAGNGVGGFYATKVLQPLGADTTGSRYLEPNGMFPNHIPNPEDETAMASICEAVVNSNADLGVIFDTDVDRGGAVDQNGKEINRNRLVAVAAAIALEGNSGATIVTDSITSRGLKDFIETTLGGKHHRFKRGYKNVINEAIKLNKQGINCPLAIETSGHAAMRNNYFLDDGAYLCTKIIIKTAQLRKQGKTLDSLIKDLKEPVKSMELRFKIIETDFKKCGETIIADLERYAKCKTDWKIANDNREGIRVSFDKDNGDGWFLLRLSVHDPIMPLNIESDTECGASIILDKIATFLQTTKGLDLSQLK